MQTFFDTNVYQAYYIGQDDDNNGNETKTKLHAGNILFTCMYHCACLIVLDGGISFHEV